MKAYVFPGQGAQFTGMGRDLYESYPQAKELFEKANELLGFRITDLMFSGTDEDLRQTKVTQPSIFLHSVILAKVMGDRFQPDMTAGHSLGEYSALVASGAMQFADAVRTVRARGTFMQEAVPVGVGSMAAILGVEPDVLQEICAEAAQGEVVSPANFNSPGQIVIAGHTGAVNRAIDIAKARGFRKAMLLPVSAPFHSHLMVPAGERLGQVLDKIEIAQLEIPVVTNVEAKANSDKGRVKELLVKQVSAPVLWDATVQEMVACGVDAFIEVGPGKVLSGLVKRIDKTPATGTIQDLASLKVLMQEGI